MDGDEMTRVMWQMVKDKLLFPYLDMDIDYYDLHVKHRDDTDDQVTVDAARAIMKYGVGIKCATITPNEDRVKEYKLKKAWKSPNGTIRAMLDGTVFRKPILVNNIKPNVSSWKKPIVIGRHAYGDVYSNTEFAVPSAGRLELVFTPQDGSKTVGVPVFNFPGRGIAQVNYNLEQSILSFARACFTYALSEKLIYGFPPKTPFPKYMMPDFVKYSTQSSKKTGKKNSTRRVLSTFLP